MANNVPNLTYIGQPLGAAAGGQIYANNNQGPLARTLTGLATIVLDGATASGTVNFIDGVQTFGKTIILPVQSVGASTGTTASLTLTQVAASSGGNALYTGTITGGAANAFVGLFFTVTGFTNPADNGVFQAVASTATTLTLANPNAVAQTHAGAAQAGVAVYSSVFGDGQVRAGDTVVIAGFTNAANNGTFTVVTAGSSSVTVNNLAAVAETNPAATLSDTTNAIPVAIAVNVTGGTQQATAYDGITVSTITSTGFTYVLSATGSAGLTINIVASIYMPGI
jgi:hypothetical protein